MTTGKRVHVTEGLFEETADGARLLGSKCATCGSTYFPKSPVCRNPKCSGSDMADASFGPEGKLWSYSTQHYAPPLPAKFDEPYEPYTLGLVDLPEGLRILGRMSTDDVDGLKSGMDVELIIDRIYSDDDGNDVVSWMFRPA